MYSADVARLYIVLLLATAALVHRRTTTQRRRSTRWSVLLIVLVHLDALQMRDPAARGHQSLDQAASVSYVVILSSRTAATTRDYNTRRVFSSCTGRSSPDTLHSALRAPLRHTVTLDI